MSGPEAKTGDEGARTRLSVEELRFAIDRESDRSPFWLTFPRDLERHFLRDTGPAWIRSDAVAVLVGLLIYNLWIISDISSAPDIWLKAAIYRSGIATPFILLLLWLDQGSQGSAGRARNQAVLILVTTLPLLLIYRSSYYPSSAMCYFLLPMVVAFGSLNISITFRYAFAITALNWLVFCAVVLSDNAIPQSYMPALIGVMTGVSVLVLVAKHRMELSGRRAWLLSSLESLRARHLADLAETLSVESNTDPLTGAANRRMLSSRLAAMCASPDGGALIMLDIDAFKAYNDRYGHQAGDTCLQKVAQIIGKRTRNKGDLLIRYGGEEFAVLLPGCRDIRALAVAEQFRRAVEEQRLPHAGLGPDHIVTVSLGVASTTGTGEDTPEGLLMRADRALYQAKSDGRNRVFPLWYPVADLSEPDEIDWAEMPAKAKRQPHVA